MQRVEPEPEPNIQRVEQVPKKNCGGRQAEIELPGPALQAPADGFGWDHGRMLQRPPWTALAEGVQTGGVSVTPSLFSSAVRGG